MQDEFEAFNEKPWPGPLPPPPAKRKEVAGGYRYDSEKGILDVDTEALDGGELKGNVPHNPSVFVDQILSTNISI